MDGNFVAPSPYYYLLCCIMKQPPERLPESSVNATFLTPIRAHEMLSRNFYNLNFYNFL